MDLVGGPGAAEVEQFGPFFVVRKSDGASIGEIGAALNVADDPATAQIGYSLVPSSGGHGRQPRRCGPSSRSCSATAR
ncbi:MAG TPA: hypothetical protein VG078_00980 [Acidimicrobiales bacterium]|nr:hypothetical protein [Acidimicrobiales bacterium]